MAKITHLAITADIWSATLVNRNLNNINLLKMFPALKQLLLVVDQRDDTYGSPGYKVLSSKISCEMRSFWAISARRMILKSNWTEEERKGGIPEVLIVNVDTATQIPKYDSEGEYGQPFVSSHSVCFSDISDYTDSTIRNLFP